MFLPRRLSKLSPAHRLRKASLLLHEAEQKARGLEPSIAAAALAYARELAAFLVSDQDSPEPVRDSAAAFLRTEAAPQGLAVHEAIRALNSLRHLLLTAGGQAQADWDFIDPATGRPDPGARKPFPGMFAYLEDIRSPFNVGSMFRSAEAFGVSELILSPDTADPGHPRAARSAMGTVDLVPWHRAKLAELLCEAGPIPAFALEVGGTPIEDFDFPDRGIVVVGSEELGVSGPALELCSLGKVSIPMVGAKGSINVGVAFGILLSAWASRLAP